MPELPNWIQNVRDHAEEAQGPWWVTIARGASGGSMYEVTTAPWKHAPNVFPLSQASMENLVSHPDVPRLIELVGEMAERLEGAVAVLDDIAAYGYDISRVQGIAREVALGQGALAKYRGEVEL